MIRAMTVAAVGLSLLFAGPVSGGWWDKKEADTTPLPSLRKSKSSSEKNKTGLTRSRTKQTLSEYLGLDRLQFRRMTNLLTGYARLRQSKTHRIQKAEKEFKALFTATAPDLAKIDAKFKEISDLQADLRFDEVRKFREARGILTMEQNRKFKKLIFEEFMR